MRSRWAVVMEVILMAFPPAPVQPARGAVLTGRTRRQVPGLAVAAPCPQPVPPSMMKRCCDFRRHVRGVGSARYAGKGEVADQVPHESPPRACRPDEK